MLPMACRVIGPRMPSSSVPTVSCRVLMARSKNAAASLESAAVSASGRWASARQIRPRSTRRLPFCVKAAIAMSSVGDDARNASIDRSASSSSPVRASVSAATRL
jgi:hypothetical protein